MTQPIRCAIVGAAGYSGAEVVSILARRADVAIVGVFGSEKRDGEERTLGSMFPALRDVCELPVKAASVEAIRELAPDAVFLATPHAVSHDLAPAVLDLGAVVFDLSGAFRLREPGLYAKHYGFEHARPDLLQSAVYGLPELNRGQIAEASLVAVPGCYPTSAVLALAPLARAGAIEAGRRPIVDSTSGVSGAGRKPSIATLFCEVSQRPYDVLHHRHNPEIDLHSGCAVVFTPHLGEYERGILSTIHVDLADGWNEAEVRRLYERAYDEEPFLRLLPAGSWPSVGAVRHSNFCDIGLALDERHRHLIVVSAIDNLVKGAAGQAVQCFNIRFGLPETAGLGGKREEARAL